MITYRELKSEDAPAFAGFTFPAFRHLLTGEPARKLLHERSDIVRPLAVGAFADQRPLGMALAAIPLDAGDPELLSVFVARGQRSKGVGTQLVALMEDRLRALDHDRVRVVYMTGRPGIDAVERVLQKREWDKPHFRMASVRLSFDTFKQASWLHRWGDIRGYETVAWAKVTDEEKTDARRRHERAPWITDRLAYWIFDVDGFEPVTSLGIRYHGELVGWIINHRHDEHTLRFTCGFIRDDLARVGLIMPAASESFELMASAGYAKAMFTTPRELGRMQEFIAKWVQPWADFVGETRGSSKNLRASSGD
jgi:GNAT superfamily N-acetyltransferase